MINIEINWIKESVRIEDNVKNTFGVVRFSEIDFSRWLDQNEETGDLNKMYMLAVERMLDNDLINMRITETGEEVF